MVRVYLDQFAWIRLARAANGRTVPDGWAEALELCRLLRQHHAVSFPLDIYRYWETNKNHNGGSRNRLAHTMMELSDFDAIVTPFQVLDHEIDLALARRFGRPTRVRAPRIFGRGITHMTAGGVKYPQDSEPFQPGSPSSSDLREPIDREAEAVLLRAGPADHARNGMALDAVPFGEMFVEHEVNIANAIAEAGVSGTRLRRAVIETDLTHDIGPAIRRRIEAAGLDLRTVVALLGDDGLVELVEELPTRVVTNNLRTIKHRHARRNQRWEPNDLLDVVCLPVPVVHCDVVMTEKRWVDSMAREGLGERFGTKLVASPQALSETLMATLR